MLRYLQIGMCMVLLGCGERLSPTLEVTASKARGGGSTSQFRITRVGLLTEGGDADSSGSGSSYRIVVDEITDSSITVTVTLARMVDGSTAEEDRQETVVPYEADTVIYRTDGEIWTARLRRNRPNKTQ